VEGLDIPLFNDAEVDELDVSAEAFGGSEVLGQAGAG